ncbi:hypothetical protein, partial [Streptomyces sp. MBT72]|uniref:hypothetical protein n=1 Tax=Streptomyces sp. MBT72 TaxID=1488402 RepID=UPI001F17E97D
MKTHDQRTRRQPTTFTTKDRAPLDTQARKRPPADAAEFRPSRQRPWPPVLPTIAKESRIARVRRLTDCAAASEAP